MYTCTYRYAYTYITYLYPKASVCDCWEYSSTYWLYMVADLPTVESLIHSLGSDCRTRQSFVWFHSPCTAAIGFCKCCSSITWKSQGLATPNRNLGYFVWLSLNPSHKLIGQCKCSANVCTALLLPIYSCHYCTIHTAEKCKMKNEKCLCTQWSFSICLYSLQCLPSAYELCGYLYNVWHLLYMW